jgi:hypothetical protein
LGPICFPWSFTHAFALVAETVDRSEDKACSTSCQ